MFPTDRSFLSWNFWSLPDSSQTSFRPVSKTSPDSVDSDSSSEDVNPKAAPVSSGTSSDAALDSSSNPVSSNAAPEHVNPEADAVSSDPSNLEEEVLVKIIQNIIEEAWPAEPFFFQPNKEETLEALGELQHLQNRIYSAEKSIYPDSAPWLYENVQALISLCYNITIRCDEHSRATDSEKAEVYQAIINVVNLVLNSKNILFKYSKNLLDQKVLMDLERKAKNRHFQDKSKGLDMVMYLGAFFDIPPAFYPGGFKPLHNANNFLLGLEELWDKARAISLSAENLASFAEELIC